MTRTVTSGCRTLLVGIDAATPALVSRLADDGDVETLAALTDRGLSGTLTSQLPPWTPSAWPGLCTGTNPGKHGVFDFLSFDGYDWEVVSATHVRERPLWQVLDREGFTSVVVNVPVTAPPEPFDGALIPGYISPEDPPCHPTGLLADVRADIGAYRVYPRQDVAGEERVAEYRRLVGMRADAFLALARRFDPDFGFVQFQVTDTVFHERPGDFEVVRAVYRAVDDAVSRILDACDPDTVILASDHGMAEYGGYEVSVNEFLAREGWLATRRGGEGMPSWATVLDESLRDGEVDMTYTPSLATHAMAVAARAGVTTQRVLPVLDALGLRDAASRIVPTGASAAAERQVDFPASRAFVRSRSELGVRLNLAGREPNGVVPADEYDAVRDRLRDLLAGFRTPDGEPVFDRVAPREEVFHGPYVERGPDLVTVPAGFEHLITARPTGDVFEPAANCWSHTLGGLLAVHGEAITEGGRVEAHLVDVAPTVLATFGVPVPERMDGEPLRAVGDPGRRSYPPYEPGATTGLDDPGVTARLENLGYLE